VLPTIANGTSPARWFKLYFSAIVCVLTGPFPLLLHQPYTRKGTPLERLHSPWLETPTAAVAGRRRGPGCLAGAPGVSGPAPPVGYWTAICGCSVTSMMRLVLLW
jgi:hypothetical protein